MNEKFESSEFKEDKKLFIEVGKKYVTRDFKNIRKIIFDISQLENFKKCKYTFAAIDIDTGILTSYTMNGEIVVGQISHADLIREVTDED
jgi:hypothetical protein